MTEPDSEVEACYQEHWRSLLEVDGVVDIELVKRELYDFYLLIDSASMVYEHVTGGKATQLNILPEVICALADDHYAEKECQFRILE